MSEAQVPGTPQVQHLSGKKALTEGVVISAAIEVVVFGSTREEDTRVNSFGTVRSFPWEQIHNSVEQKSLTEVVIIPGVLLFPQLLSSQIPSTARGSWVNVGCKGGATA